MTFDEWLTRQESETWPVLVGEAKLARAAWEAATERAAGVAEKSASRDDQATDSGAWQRQHAARMIAKAIRGEMT